MERKPYHYWAINKKVFRLFWNGAPRRVREIVAAGAFWCEEYGEFLAAVERETDKLFLDPEYYYNKKTTFQYDS